MSTVPPHPDDVREGLRQAAAQRAEAKRLDADALNGHGWLSQMVAICDTALSLDASPSRRRKALAECARVIQEAQEA